MKTNLHHVEGSTFASRKKKSERPKGDFYSTPKSLVWVVENLIKDEFCADERILEPCCGRRAISEELIRIFGPGKIAENDLFNQYKDVLSSITSFNYPETFIYDTRQMITNPPFSLWDAFVRKAKSHCLKFMVIGRMNYFGTHDRNQSNLWDNLKIVLPFDRYVDYQTPYRTDGLFHVGSQATGWFLFDMEYQGKPYIETLNVQKYAKLGPFKKRGKE